MIHIRSVLSRLSSGVRSRLPKYDTIGGYRIRLPAGSCSLEYKRRFRLYDVALGEITRRVRSKYPNLCAIDIGANVGDTAALIRKYSDVPVLCIEGDPKLLPILTENAAQLGPNVVIEPTFVGRSGALIDPALIDDAGRNASLVAATTEHGTIKLRSLGEIVEAHPSFSAAKLLKTDTEGFDFDILRESLDFIRVAKPVIFFEYDPHFRPSESRAGIDTIEALVDTGYSDFIYYDNFGNLLLRANAGQSAIFEDLHRYLASNRRSGIAVYYFDVCAFHGEDADLACLVRTDASLEADHG